MRDFVREKKAGLKLIIIYRKFIGKFFLNMNMVLYLRKYCKYLWCKLESIYKLSLIIIMLG